MPLHEEPRKCCQESRQAKKKKKSYCWYYIQTQITRHPPDLTGKQLGIVCCLFPLPVIITGRRRRTCGRRGGGGIRFAQLARPEPWPLPSGSSRLGWGRTGVKAPADRYFSQSLAHLASQRKTPWPRLGGDFPIRAYLTRGIVPTRAWEEPGSLGRANSQAGQMPVYGVWVVLWWKSALHVVILYIVP